MVSPVKRFIKVISVCFLVAVNFSFYTGECSAGSATRIRVAIARDVKSLSLSVKGFYRLTDSVSGKVLSRGKYLKTALTADKNNVMLAAAKYSAAKVSIEADDPESISIDGRKYRGNIELVRKSNARLSVVNYIDLEDYVKGILYHEASHYWPQEALKAQAVVCRTYAVYQMRQNSGRDFDVTSDVYSQVYGGKTSERYRTNQAVDQTHGQVLIYKGKVFPAYFHSTCAGHTEDASLVWNIDAAPLRGVSCDFCKESPHFNWHQAVPLSRIKQALLKAGYKECGTIEAMVVMARDTSGRIKDLLIKTGTKDIRIAGKDFRSILGPDIIRSANFKIDLVSQSADFTGIGWGHGVGMCQWGAYFMAKDGYSYTQILEYYYPGSEIS